MRCTHLWRSEGDQQTCAALVAKLHHKASTCSFTRLHILPVDVSSLPLFPLLVFLYNVYIGTLPSTSPRSGHFFRLRGRVQIGLAWPKAELLLQRHGRHCHARQSCFPSRLRPIGKSHRYVLRPASYIASPSSDPKNGVQTSVRPRMAFRRDQSSVCPRRAAKLPEALMTKYTPLRTFGPDLAHHHPLMKDAYGTD